MKNAIKKHDYSLPVRQTRKEMISYYDMGALPAVRYEPIDEFLGMIKRFGKRYISEGSDRDKDSGYNQDRRYRYRGRRSRG